MTEWIDILRFGDPISSPPIQETALALLLGFVLGQIIGWVYMATHTTPSYSSSFVASLVVLPVIVGLMMILMAGSLISCGPSWKGWPSVHFDIQRRSPAPLA